MSRSNSQRTPSNIPFDPAASLPNSIAQNYIVTGTGNTFPSPIIMASSIKGGTFSSTAHGIDLNPATPLTAGLFRNPINGNVNLASGATNTFSTTSGSGAFFQVSNSAVTMSAGSGNARIFDGTGYGTTGQVLTADGSNNCTWQDASSSVPGFQSTIISHFAWGGTVSANSAFYPSNDIGVDYWYDVTSPPPSSTPITPVGSENYGTVSLDLPPANYALTGTCLTQNNCGILKFTINGSVTNFDSYTPSSLQNAFYIPFTVTSGTTTITLECVSKNISSSSYNVYPMQSGWVVTYVYS